MVTRYSSFTSRPAYVTRSTRPVISSASLCTASAPARTRSSVTLPATAASSPWNCTSSTPLSKSTGLSTRSTSSAAVSPVTSKARLRAALTLPYASRNMPSGTVTSTWSRSAKRARLGSTALPSATAISFGAKITSDCSSSIDVTCIDTTPFASGFTDTSVSSTSVSTTSDTREASVVLLSGCRLITTSGGIPSTRYTPCLDAPVVWKRS